MVVKPAKGWGGKAVGVTCIRVLVSVRPAKCSAGIFFIHDQTVVRISYVVNAVMHWNYTSVNRIALIEISYIFVFHQIVKRLAADGVFKSAKSWCRKPS